MYCVLLYEADFLAIGNVNTYKKNMTINNYYCQYYYFYHLHYLLSFSLCKIASIHRLPSFLFFISFGCCIVLFLFQDLFFLFFFLLNNKLLLSTIYVHVRFINIIINRKNATCRDSWFLVTGIISVPPSTFFTHRYRIASFIHNLLSLVEESGMYALCKQHAEPPTGKRTVNCLGL